MQFVAPPGVVFYRIDSTESPVRICLPPCQVPMAGSTRLALSLNGDSPVTAPEKLNLTANSVVEGDYRSGSGKRTTGLILLALGIPAGIGTVAAGAGLVDVEPEDERWVAVSTIVGGALVLVGSLIAGIIWASTADEAHVFERSSEEPLGF